MRDLLGMPRLTAVFKFVRKGIGNDTLRIMVNARNWKGSLLSFPKATTQFRKVVDVKVRATHFVDNDLVNDQTGYCTQK